MDASHLKKLMQPADPVAVAGFEDYEDDNESKAGR
jgi:hypothetical protein